MPVCPLHKTSQVANSLKWRCHRIFKQIKEPSPDPREYTWSSWQEYLNDDGILPTLCYTRAVLKRITLDNLKELVDETLDGDITDVEYTTDDRLTDDDIRQYLRAHWHLEHPTDLQKKEKQERNEILVEALLYSAPLRQLSD